MPNIAILNNKVITTSDIYKYNIDKSSKFTCFNCNKQLHFRQSRNADNDYTEHFFHPNTIKNKHIECEKNTLERLTTNDTWHNKFSNFIDQPNREVIRDNNNVKHIVDAYDEVNDMGIEFQNSPISVEAIQSRDNTTYLDWIFNVETKYIKKINIGNKIICEIPHDNWEKAVKVVKNNVFLYTGCKEWILLDDRESYHIEIDNKIRNVWIGSPCSFQTIYDSTCLQNMLTEEGLEYFQNNTKELEIINIIYARCKKSMLLLDNIHRRYINKHKFNNNDIIAIKSVAGSGKTTTLLKLAKIHNTKKILYLAFNKSLINDISHKIKQQNINNIIPYTFHSLAYNAYSYNKKRDPIISELRPQTIHEYIPWFKGKPFEIRKYYVDLYTKFCRQPIYSNPNEYTYHHIGKDKPLLNTLWNKTLLNNFLTFDSLLKMSHINHWLKGYIDNNFDMIMIDETQDFDLMMLNMLLNDTTIPKIFVGDPNQSIYEWRGCINAFDYLPKTALIIEFYSTFRIGDPACELIRSKFKNCWMISKSQNQTILSTDKTLLTDINYVYLFRTWKSLLQTAKNIKNIWISNYEQQVEKMRKLHTILTTFGGNIENEEFSDDLPLFLKTLTKDDLENLIIDIDNNFVCKDKATCKFYTIHSYKGLEDNYVRISYDIEDCIGEKDLNLYYVALTRGMKYIIEDIE